MTKTTYKILQNQAAKLEKELIKLKEDIKIFNDNLKLKKAKKKIK